MYVEKLVITHKAMNETSGEAEDTIMMTPSYLQIFHR